MGVPLVLGDTKTMFIIIAVVVFILIMCALCAHELDMINKEDNGVRVCVRTPMVEDDPYTVLGACMYTVINNHAALIDMAEWYGDVATPSTYMDWDAYMDPTPTYIQCMHDVRVDAPCVLCALDDVIPMVDMPSLYLAHGVGVQVA